MREIGQADTAAADVLAEVRRLGFQTPREAAVLIRSDRDRR
jgi:hypothetical protein